MRRGALAHPFGTRSTGTGTGTGTRSVGAISEHIAALGAIEYPGAR